MDDKNKRVAKTSESSEWSEMTSDHDFSTIDWSTAGNIISAAGDQFEFADNNDDQQGAAAAISDDVVSKRPPTTTLEMIRREHSSLKNDLLLSQSEFLRYFEARRASENAELARLNSKVDDLSQKLNVANEERAEMGRRLEYLTKLEAERLKLPNVELQQQSVRELSKTNSELLDQATARNSDITKNAESLADQNRELTDELWELKLREEGFLNDISKLKQENVALQKELRSLESAKVDLKNYMEQVAKRFSEETERVRARLEEETKSGQLVKSDLATGKKELQVVVSGEPRYPDRILLAVGGRGPDDELAGSIEAYDPKIRSWTELNITDPNGPRGEQGCVIFNGELWTIGGYNEGYLNSVRKLNLVTKQWSDCAPMNQRRGFVSVAHHNGHIWAMGGYGEGDERKTAERYDPNDRKWSFISPLSVPRNAAYATVCSDKIYIAGGFHGKDTLDSVEYYDAATDRWILLTAPMKHRRAGFGCACLDGVIYVVGGHNAQNIALSSAERYDPRTGRWDQLSDMATCRKLFGIECVDGKIIVAGGLNNGISDIAECEYYEPSTNSWAPLAPMNEKRMSLYCVTVEGMANDIFK